MPTASKPAKNAPPAMLLPHMKQFVAEWQTPARTYRFSFDEALKRSKTDALAMRRDGHILSLLQARLLPVLGADWCVKSENDQYKDQATLYQKLIEKTPRLLQLRKCLLEAVWFGRYGVQFSFGRVDVDGKSMTGITAWKPVNGDKINFREDGTPTIRIMPSFASKLKEQGATVEEPKAPVTAWNDQGTVLILDKPEYRSRFAIHVHEIEDADFMEPELAGSVGGVGLRHYCYWVWWLRQEIMEWLLSYLEMMGAGGLTIVGYDMSNPHGLDQAKAAFKERATVVYLPIPPGQDKQTNIVQRVEPSGTGNDIFSGWVDGYFNGILTRLIIGQDLSSSSNSTGLGSGVADLQASVKECIHRYDAKNLNETETQQILDVLVKLNEPQSSYGLKCQTILQKVDPEKGLQAAQKAYDMGATLPESHVLQLANIPEVKEGEKTLTNPQIAHEAGLASMYQSQQQGGTMGLEEARRMLGEQGIPEEEQLHHLADMVDNGELEEIDADGGVQYAQPRQQQAGEDDAEPQEEPQTYAKEDWREETGPKGGRRWVNIKSGRIEYREPGDERTRGWMAGEDKDKPKETDKGERSVGNPRKGMLTQGAYQTLDKALRGESSKTLQGEGVLSHVMHADKRLLKDQVVSLAAQHGMQIDSRTTKTRALAFIEDKLRSHASKGADDGQPRSETGKADGTGKGAGVPATTSGGSLGGSGGGDTRPGSVDAVSAQGESQAVPKGQEISAEPDGMEQAGAGRDESGMLDNEPASGVDSAEAGDDSFDFGANENPFEPAAKVDAGELPKRGKESLKEYLAGLGASEAHDSLRDYAKQLHETAKAETKSKNAAIGYAAKLIGQYGDKPLTKNHKAFIDGDLTQLPRFDEVTSAVDLEHPGLLQGDEQEKGQQLFEMLKAGTQSATPLAAFEDQAVQEWHEAGRPLPQSKKELAEAAKPDPFKSTPEQNDEAFDKFASKAKSGGLNIPDDFREQPGSGAVSGNPVERDTMAMLQAKMKRENEQVKTVDKSKQDASLADMDNQHIAKALDDYENGSDRLQTIGDLVNHVESLDDLHPEIEQAIEAYRNEESDDRDLKGRGDMDQAEESFLSVLRKHGKPSEVEQNRKRIADAGKGRLEAQQKRKADSKKQVANIDLSPITNANTEQEMTKALGSMIAKAKNNAEMKTIQEAARKWETQQPTPPQEPAKPANAGDGKSAAARSSGNRIAVANKNKGAAMGSFNHKGHYFRIQPKGKSISSHFSEDSAGDSKTLHVFESPFHALHSEGNPNDYGDEVVAISHDGNHVENGDVEGVGINPKKSKIVKRWTLQDFAKEFFPSASGDDEEVSMSWAGNEHWHHARNSKDIDLTSWERLRDEHKSKKISGAKDELKSKRTYSRSSAWHSLLDNLGLPHDLIKV
ncbi:MAG TPA: DUF935 family protein [Gemmatales bacterium]|nr:DUF935 family protein [Gemmatales bacterium]